MLKNNFFIYNCLILLILILKSNFSYSQYKYPQYRKKLNNDLIKDKKRSNKKKFTKKRSRIKSLRKGRNRNIGITIRLSGGVGHTTGKIVGPNGNRFAYSGTLNFMYMFKPLQRSFGIGLDMGYILLHKVANRPPSRPGVGNLAYIPLIVVSEYNFPHKKNPIFFQVGAGILVGIGKSRLYVEGVREGKREFSFSMMLRVGGEIPLFFKGFHLFVDAKQYLIFGEIYRLSSGFNFGIVYKF